MTESGADSLPFFPHEIPLIIILILSLTLSFLFYILSRASSQKLTRKDQEDQFQAHFI